MWGATILLLIAAAAIGIAVGPISGLAVAALGSAALLAVLHYLPDQSLDERSCALEIVDGVTHCNIDQAALQKKAS